MNKKETIKLFSECQTAFKLALIADPSDFDFASERAKDVWNAWARKLLEEKEQLQERGQWSVKLVLDEQQNFFRTIGLNQETQDWLSKACVDFSSINFVQSRHRKKTFAKLWQSFLSLFGSSKKFTGSRNLYFEDTLLNFNGYIFPGETCLRNVTADCDAIGFYKTIFSDCLLFSNIQSRTLVFQKTSFLGDVKFNGVNVDGQAFFIDAQFSKSANFSNIKFTAGASFEGAKFHSNVAFKSATFQCEKAISGGTLFISDGTSFSETQFCSNVCFIDTCFSDIKFTTSKFEGDALFHRIHVKGNARFNPSTFLKRCEFHDIIFEGNAQFSHSKFSETPEFLKTVFYKNALFNGIKIKNEIKMTEVNFLSHTPNFNGLHSKELNFNKVTLCGEEYKHISE